MAAERRRAQRHAERLQEAWAQRNGRKRKSAWTCRSAFSRRGRRNGRGANFGLSREQQSAQSWSPAFFEARGSRTCASHILGTISSHQLVPGPEDEKGREKPGETRSGPPNVGGRCSGPSLGKLRPGTLPIRSIRRVHRFPGQFGRTLIERHRGSEMHRHRSSFCFRVPLLLLRWGCSFVTLFLYIFLLLCEREKLHRAVRAKRDPITQRSPRGFGSGSAGL